MSLQAHHFPPVGETASRLAYIQKSGAQILHGRLFSQCDADIPVCTSFSRPTRTPEADKNVCITLYFHSSSSPRV